MTSQLLDQEKNMTDIVEVDSLERKVEEMRRSQYSPRVGRLLLKLDKIIKAYAHLSIETLSEEQLSNLYSEIVNRQDVVTIRNELSGFVEDEKKKISEIRDLGLQRHREELAKDGREMDVQEYAIVESVCHNPHKNGKSTSRDFILGKAIVPGELFNGLSNGELQKSLDGIELKYSDLIYSHHKEKIEKGKIMCTSCKDSAGTLYYAGRLTVVKEKVQSKQELESQVVSAVASQLGMKPKAVRDKLEKAIIKKKGYDSLYDCFEQTTAFTLELSDLGIENYFDNGKKASVVDYLEKAVEGIIPKPRAAFMERIKDASLAEKTLIVRHGHKHNYSNGEKRTLYDLGAIREILFGDASKCYDAREWIEEHASSMQLKVVNLDDKIKRRTADDYQAIHLDLWCIDGDEIIEYQIKTNERDNAAEHGRWQAHSDYRAETKKRIEDIVKSGIVAHNEVFLTVLILTPTQERAYRRLNLQQFSSSWDRS